jgi:two-component sensor histidine kinase
MASTSQPSNDAGAAHAGPTPGSALRVGHVYFDVRHKRVYCLNSIARQMHSDGVPLVFADLSEGGLSTRAGEPVSGRDLPLHRAWHTEKSVEAEYLLPRQSGKPWQVNWTATPFRDAGGEVIGVLGSVVCGPAQPDTRTMAELAHDLRTPLQSLRLLCSLLERLPPDDAEVPGTLQAVRASAERAVQIALELLECCRGPAPKRNADAEGWFPLDSLLVNLANEQAVAAKEKSLKLTTDLAAVAGWQIRADRTRLGRVLSNLLVNAVRYTPSGGVHFSASWRHESGQRILDLNVADTGPGMTEEEQESIFHPFERGSAGIQGDSGGSGLGLAVVDRLVEELGFAIEVFSQYGRGSMFHLLVPDSFLRQGAKSAS